MSNYTATLFKAGNSFALRVPREYVSIRRLKLGQKVPLANDTAIPAGYDEEVFWQAVKELQALPARDGSLKAIKDPMAWQRELRKSRPLPGRE